ncbi:MAG: LAGLIDADG family homing endonuclease [Dehalococcoidales bacterium]|nr:LAGLIDADG family homing endonuclease [Dehalococcoidales bacterium]
MVTDMEILHRALNFEKRGPQAWEIATVGASRQDINRLVQAEFVEQRAHSSKIQTGVYGPALYRLTEKGRRLVIVQDEINPPIPAEEIIASMSLIVGFDDLKDAIAHAIEERKRIHFLMEGPPASIHGSTEVWIDQGNGPECLPIASLEGKRFKTLAVHPVTLKSDWYDAELSKHDYDGEWVEITGVGILPFTVTATHSLVAYDPCLGCLIPKKAADLKVGELLPILSKWHSRWMVLPQGNQIFINHVPVVLDGEFGFMLGFWLGDGGLSQGATKLITFSNHDNGVLKRIQSYLYSMKGSGRYYRGGNLRRDRLMVQHQPLFNFLQKQFLYGDGKPGIKGRTSRWKKLPPWVMQAPEEFICELLNGYFYADGTVANGVISATSTSPNLARDIAMLITRLGITPAIQHRGKDAQSVAIRQCDAQRFMDKVGVFRKNRTVTTSVLMHDEAFKIPFPFGPQVAQSLQSSLRKGRRSQSFTRRSATELMASGWHDQLMNLLNADIRWVRVEHLRQFSEPEQIVYDLSVPEAETFVLGNRVLVHNCAKSLILEAVRSAVPTAYMAFGSRTSGRGLSDKLFEIKPSVLLMDEADKMRHDVFSLMLGLMAAGEIIETKSGNTRGLRLETMVIAACNSSKKMPAEFLSRFAMHVKFPHYTREEFINVCQSFLSRVEGCPEDLSAKIGRLVFDSKLGDVRKAKGVWQLMREPTDEDMLRVLRMMTKYSSVQADRML